MSATNEISVYPASGLTGRRKIETAVREINAANVREVLGAALAIHGINKREIDYLWDYYRGKQDVRLKVKLTREAINNIVCVNRANEIVTFKTAYLLNEPIQYGSNGEDIDRIRKLNDAMRDEDKESKDKEIVDWVHICGVGERLCLPRDDGMCAIYTLDPREAFVIYSSRIERNSMAGVIIQKDEDGSEVFTVYTKTKVFTVTRDEVIEEDHILGEIPLVEYLNNAARMGAFESVISILNAINRLESDAVDSIQDFVNGFDVFQNCEVGDGDYANLAIGGQAVMVKTTAPGVEAKVYRVASELNQSGVQERINDLTEDYLTICGMPNRNGGSSTSDTGAAVIFRDGFWEAESRAKDSEKLFKRSERQFLRVVMNILGDDLRVPVGEISIDFGRHALNNMQSKFQCMCEGLANDYIDPQDVYNAFGDIFGDKVAAYQRGMAYHAKKTAESEETIARELDDERKRVQESGRSDS